ncbi:MAG TPA: UDP-N-acetylmuramoyl-tripeptide--D-alanyl-D-alanine ligase [Gammaproteobacteria bacterium]|nr:UDP-N-acetylmuramoyl-tripeptide--D-alanyl-D-alanine ligase [Gammaproteobacteria bacterium]
MQEPVTGLTAEFVANALDLPSGDYRRRVFTGVTSDTRGDVAGSLFVAIRGERFDAHRFIETAIAAGATGIIAERDQVVVRDSDVAIFPVDDTLTAWRRIAAAWRQRFTLPVIAVGGSAGKTTTKNLLAAMLAGKFRNVLATSGSQNGYLGLAMTLTALRLQHEAAVVEIGIDARGAMAEHAALVQPDAAVVTAIGVEHLETLGDIDTVAAEECRLLNATAERGGTIFVHDDDARLQSYATTYAGERCIAYGLGGAHGPDRACGRIDTHSLVMDGLGLSGVKLPLPLVGRHNALNVLAAAAIARKLGLDGDEIRAGLATFTPDAARSNCIELSDDIVALADYYNASPLSMTAALDALAELGERRRWLCLGDMLELGPDELNFHRALATPIIDSAAYGVLLYGPRMKALAEALRYAAFQGEVVHFEDKAALADTLTRRIGPGDAILIKGSRGMAMEDVMTALVAQSRSRGSSTKLD